jgi:hypothetical protein
VKIKYKYLTQTQLGSLFGASSHEVGKWLVAVGLRDKKTKKPTDAAHRGGFCETAPSGQVGYHWVWESQKTSAALRAAGHRLAESLPEQLVVPPELIGPFSVDPSGCRHVLNGGGEVVVRTTSDQNAKIIARLLNAAHRSGALDRLLPANAPPSLPT